MPFPGWGQFEGPDSADLDEETRRSIASAAIPVPESVTKGVVRLADERRFDVPSVRGYGVEDPHNDARPSDAALRDGGHRRRRPHRRSLRKWPPPLTRFLRSALPRPAH